MIHEASIEVRPGQVVSIVGPNGSGKSTLLKAVVGVVKALSGSVVLDGEHIENRAPEDIARIGVGYVPQVDDVFGSLTVKENLEMGGYQLPTREVVGQIERVAGYFPRLATMMNRHAARLSGGERKMLAMGRVLMVQPSLFVLDEPTANLAPLIATELLNDHVRRLALAGASVLLVEQRARAVLEISDNTYVVAGGRIRMEGSPAHLSASADFATSFLGGTPVGDGTTADRT